MKMNKLLSLLVVSSMFVATPTNAHDRNDPRVEYIQKRQMERQRDHMKPHRDIEEVLVALSVLSNILAERDYNRNYYTYYDPRLRTERDCYWDVKYDYTGRARRVWKCNRW